MQTHLPTNFTILRFHETRVWQISRIGKNHDRGIKFSLLKSSDSKLYRSVHNSIPPMWALFQKNVTYGFIRKLNKEIRDKLSILFINVHSITKFNRPISDYLWLCSLDEKKPELWENLQKYSQCFQFCCIFSFYTLVQYG